MIEPIVVETVSAVAAQAVGKTVGTLSRRGRGKRGVKMPALDDVPESLTSKLTSLTEQERSIVARFIESPEMGQIALFVAGYIVHHPELLSDKEGDLVSMLRQSLRLAGLRSPVASRVAQPLYDTVVATVANAVSKVRPALPAPSARQVMSYAASIARSSEMYSQLRTLTAIDRFASRLRSQTEILHSTIRPPQAEADTAVPISKLYVEPTLHALRPDSNQVAHQDFRAEDVVESSLRVVVLGDPGGGKSTLAQN